MGTYVNSPEKWEAYYNGEHRLDAIGVSLPPNVRVLEMPVRWPKLSIDVLVESLVLDGFSLADEGEIHEAPEKLNRILQANNFRTLLTLALTEALIQGCSYMVVGGSADSDIPMVSVHAGNEFELEKDYAGRMVRAVRRYRSGKSEYKAVYEPNVTTWWRAGGSGAELVAREEHGLGRIPVVPFVNQIRLGEAGRSEIEEIHQLCDAASRTITNLQVAQELLAMPTRYLFGDGVDEALSAEGAGRIEAYFGRFIVGPSDAKTGTIPGADLSQLLNTFKLYAQQVSAMTGIPPFMMGISADSNPASAEAMRSAKDRLITRAELKQNLFGDAVEELARLVLAVAGEDVTGLETLEARWRDPAVISVSARNALMLQAQAQGIISEETAREYLGLTPEQIKRDRHLDQSMRAMTGG